jgi:hypothetical protein
VEIDDADEHVEIDDDDEHVAAQHMSAGIRIAACSAHIVACSAHSSTALVPAA